MTGCWDISKHLARRAEFAYRIRRALVLVRLHELGIMNASGCIIGEIYTINRRYFQNRSDVIARLSLLLFVLLGAFRLSSLSRSRSRTRTF